MIFKENECKLQGLYSKIRAENPWEIDWSHGSYPSILPSIHPCILITTSLYDCWGDCHWVRGVVHTNRSAVCCRAKYYMSRHIKSLQTKKKSVWHLILQISFIHLFTVPLWSPIESNEKFQGSHSRKILWFLESYISQNTSLHVKAVSDIRVG